MRTGGADGRRQRLGRLGMTLLLLLPLVTVTAATGPRPAPDRPSATETPAGRIAFAGTRHRSLGRADEVTASTPLFPDGPAHHDLQPSARGDLLVFASRRDERHPQIYLRAADGSVRRLTSGRNAANPQLTPDGQAVVFDSAEPAAGGGTQRDLWLVRTDGTRLTRLTDTPDDEEHPTVSPDGRRLAYAGDVAGAGPQIYVRDLAGGPATRLTDPADGTATEPAWNPVDDAAHRDRVAYTRTGPDGPRLRVTDGQRDEPLLGGDQADWRAHAPAWLPNGDELLFLSPEITCTCTGDWDHVYRTPAHSANVPEAVLNEDRELASPTWLGPRDGGVAVVERVTAATRHTVTLQDIRADGSDPRDLGLEILVEDPAADVTTDPTRDPLFQPGEGYDPWTIRQAYSPNGRRLAVTRFEGEPGQRSLRVWLADVDGRDAAPLPLAGRQPGDWDTDPSFSPDGRYLAFTRMSPGGVGPGAGRGRILIADVATGAIRGRITPPPEYSTSSDAQPAWSPDGTTLAFTRTQQSSGDGAKHVWTVPVDDLDQQRDLSATQCPGTCQVVDDSPAFSPDGTTLALNRRHGGAPGLDERNGLLLFSLSDEDCRVLLPDAARALPGACRRELPDTSATGPHQPRDAAWTPDGTALVVSARADLPPNSPEKLELVDATTGERTPLTGHLPGRQKEPTVQRTADLTVRAPDTVSPVTVGDTTEVRVDVVNNGPAASPDTRLTVAPPTGLTVTALQAPDADCDTETLTCDLGTVPAGAPRPVTATLTGVTAGEHPVDWSVTGTVVDVAPSDNTARTLVPVRPAADPPADTPPPPTTPPAPPPAPEPEPEAGPGVTVTAQPNPGYVGGHVVVTYTVRNGRQALATGLRLRIGLPPGVPHNGPPPGCDRGWECALPDLAPGARAVVRVVLTPDKAFTGQVTGELTTTGTDADPRDNTTRQRLRVLQPRIVAVPEVGTPGFVTSVRGTDFPPGVPVRFRWQPGITAPAAPTVPGPDGTFIGQLLVLPKDQTGPRTITARGPGFSPVTTDFLVVPGTVQPPGEVIRR